MDEISACIDGYRKVPLPTDHFKINKYSGPDDPSYLAVYPLVVDMAQNAVRVVQDRLDRKQIWTYLCAQADISVIAQTIVEDNSSMKNTKDNYRPCRLTLVHRNTRGKLELSAISVPIQPSR